MIRHLIAKDSALFKAIRLEAVQKHPEAFSGSYEEESLRNDKAWQDRLERSEVFGFFDNGQLVGIIGYYRYDGIKDAHRAEVYTTYLKETARRKGIMAALIEALAVHARQKGIEQLELDVNINLSQAIKCYERCGFKVYGTKPRTIKINGDYIDTYMMVKYL